MIGYGDLPPLILSGHGLNLRLSPYFCLRAAKDLTRLGVYQFQSKLLHGPKIKWRFDGGPVVARLDMNRDMRFPKMWYVRQAKPQISLRIPAV